MGLVPVCVPVPDKSSQGASKRVVEVSFSLLQLSAEGQLDGALRIRQGT